MAKGGSSKAKRRIVYIEKKFQRRFIVMFCLVAVGAMALASLVLYLLLHDTITVSYQYHRLDFDSTADAIVPAMVVTNLAVLAGFVCITVFVTLFISFRIGGPLYRFSQDMLLIGEGKLSKRVRLRNGDQLTGFTEAINKMAEGLDQKMREIQEKAKTLSERVSSAVDCPRHIVADVQELNQAVQSKFETTRE